MDILIQREKDVDMTGKFLKIIFALPIDKGEDI